MHFKALAPSRGKPACIFLLQHRGVVAVSFEGGGGWTFRDPIHTAASRHWRLLHCSMLFPLGSGLFPLLPLGITVTVPTCTKRPSRNEALQSQRLGCREPAGPRRRWQGSAWALPIPQAPPRRGRPQAGSREQSIPASRPGPPSKGSSRKELLVLREGALLGLGCAAAAPSRCCCL